MPLQGMPKEEKKPTISGLGLEDYLILTDMATSSGDLGQPAGNYDQAPVPPVNQPQQPLQPPEYGGGFGGTTMKEAAMAGFGGQRQMEPQVSTVKPSMGEGLGRGA